MANNVIVTVVALSLCLFGIIGLAFIFIYNSLVTAKTRVDETWRQIDVRLQNRYDLLPDLIQAVEKVVSADQEIQTKIAELRSAADIARSTQSEASNANQKALAENTLTGAIQALRVTLEAYPELKSQEAIKNFMDQDSVIEEKIAAARQIYNTTAREYNEKIATIPNKIVAWLMGYKPASYFEASENAKYDIEPRWGGQYEIRKE
ncbi:MAG: LemA family protein [Candidatus Dojkabacteria bacterium]|nr:MAG: LemA family protein [Candidatus Dojkabacteria bacterium]